MQAIITVAMLAIGLSMDAFAVSICKGLCMDRADNKKCAIVGLWFGGAQALMPLIGFLLGSAFSRFIEPVDHWVAFVLLGFLGVNMLRESLSKEDECESCDASFAFKTMLVMAIATSIDALAVGITFALLPNVNIFIAVGSIGVITFLFSAVGVKIGAIFGAKNKKYAEMAGGIVLILIGVKILLEHLGVLPF